MANLFHTSLFGYSKTSVNDYISRLNEEFSQKLLKKDWEHKQEMEALQAEAAGLAEKNEQLQALRQEIADALISAREYAASLKKQAEEEERARKAADDARREAELMRIRRTAEQINSLQRTFRDALENMEHEMASYGEELQRLQKEAAGQADAEEQKLMRGEEKKWGKEDGQTS